ncbi:MAG TPA: hypothetical protein PKB03_10750 [Baekduia sp.]|nr:hypothetical protein [Baekduia sp.]
MRQILYRLIVDFDTLPEACRHMSAEGVLWETIVRSRETGGDGRVAELEVWGNNRAPWPASVLVHHRERKLLKRLARQHRMIVLRTTARIVQTPPG